MRAGRSGMMVLCGLALAAGPAAAAASGAALQIFGAAGAAGAAPLHRLDGSLRALAAEPAAATADLAHLRTLNPALRLRVAAPLLTPEILLDAVADHDAAPLQRQLQALGLRESTVFANAVGGWLPVTALAQAAQLPALRLARASLPRTRTTGPVAVQGDYAQRSAALRTANPSLTGAGITVGVLSDSFNCYDYYAQHGPAAATSNGLFGYATNGFTATYASDEASGALPAGIQVLEEASCPDYNPPQQKPFGDEGRAMLQIVHAVAPGASLAFHTAVNSEADFANGIVALQQLGARIIVDDIGYPDEPFFQDGVVAQAVDQVAAAGVAYFSAAGNDGRNAWETTDALFTNDAAAASEPSRLDFSGGGAVLSLPVSVPAIPPGDYVNLVLQWDQPFVTGAPGSSGASSQLDLCIDSATPQSDEVAGTASGNGGFQSVSYPACTGPNDLGSDPLQILQVGNPANAAGSTQPQTINISIRLTAGSAPGRIKLLVDDDGLGAAVAPSLATQSPTMQGHPLATGAVAMAAAFYMQTPDCGTSPAVLESYSSWGGDPILFDTSGNRLAQPETRTKPDLTGPDGANDTFLGQVWSGASQTVATAACQSNPAYPNFFGTSAAAPHAAGAAALLWQSQSGATAAQVIAALKSGAVSMGSGQAGGSGAGFIQADAALAQLPAAAATPPASHHGGGGALGWPLLAVLAAWVLGSASRPRAVRPALQR